MESESPPSRTTTTLLGSFLRGRPRNTSTSERERELSPSPSNPQSTAQQSARGRRQQHIAANSTLNSLQPSASQPQPSSTSNVSGLGLSSMLRRRRSAGNVAQQQHQQQQQQAPQQQAPQQQHSQPHPPNMQSHSGTAQNVLALATGLANPTLPGRPNPMPGSDPAHPHVPGPNHNTNPSNGATNPPPNNAPNGASATPTSESNPAATTSVAGGGIHPHPNPHASAHRIRLVPHIDSRRSLRFDPISRTMREGDPAIRIGRFTDRSGLGLAAVNSPTSNKLAFRSKVVSRAHAELWVEPGGRFFIRDTKSSSGTFLNHVRLSTANVESRPFQIKDGDVLQLGVDYQGGTEDVYKSVKIRIEIGREWQSGANAFNTAAFKNLKALTAPAHATVTSAKSKPLGIPDCCICLFTISIRQALFTAPCSHTFHYKCIRPIIESHHPAFSCPLCRTFADLEEDVEMDDAEFVRGDDTSSNEQAFVKPDVPDGNDASAGATAAQGRGSDGDGTGGADNGMDVDQEEQANNQTEVEDQQPQTRAAGFGTRRRGPSVLPEVDEPGPEEDMSDSNANAGGNLNTSALLARLSPSPENDVDLDHARSCRHTLFNPSLVQRIDDVSADDNGYVYPSTVTGPMIISGLHSVSNDNNVDNPYADPSTVGSHAMLGIGINGNASNVWNNPGTNPGPGSSVISVAPRGRSESPFGGGVFGTTLGRPVEK